MLCARNHKTRILVALIAVGTFYTGVVFAQSDELKSALKDVTESVDQLAEVKASTTPVQDDEKKRVANQEALLKIFDFTTTEAKELKKKFNSAKAGADEKFAVAISGAVKVLDGYMQEITIWRKSVSNSTSGEAVVAAATDFKVWREKTYDTFTKKTLDAILVVQSATVLKTAQTRLEGINADIKRFSTTLGMDVSAFVPLVADAGKLLKSAKNKQDSAYALAVKTLLAIPSSNEPEPAPISLNRGIGEFTACIPRTVKGDVMQVEVCRHGFVRVDGLFYAFEYEDGMEKTEEQLREVFTVNGFFTPAPKATSTNERFVGTVRVMSVNAAEEQSASFVKLDKPTVQSYVKSEFEDISEAYKKFFSMSKLAKRLLAP